MAYALILFTTYRPQKAVTSYHVYLDSRRSLIETADIPPRYGCCPQATLFDIRKHQEPCPKAGPLKCLQPLARMISPYRYTPSPFRLLITAAKLRRIVGLIREEQSKISIYRLIDMRPKKNWALRSHSSQIESRPFRRRP